MIPEDIDTGLDNPEDAFRAIASNMLPIIQMASLGNVAYQLASEAGYVLKEWQPLATSLMAHADYKDSHRDTLRQLDRLKACLDRLLEKEGLHPRVYAQARAFAYHVGRLREHYELRYIHKRRPDCSYAGPPTLRLVED